MLGDKKMNFKASIFRIVLNERKRVKTLTAKIMKKDIIKTSVGFLFILIFTTLSFSQGKNFDYQDAGISITVPDGWTVKEHGVVFLTSKEEDLSIQFEILNVPDIEKAVSVAEIELKAMFPQDPSISVNDLEINTMRVKEINKTAGNRQAIYYLLETPGNRFIQVFCITTKDVALKYKATISKIVENLKPLG